MDEYIRPTYHESMNFTSQELLAEFSDMVLSTHGADAEFDHSACHLSANNRSLVFLQSASDLPINAAVIVTTLEVAEQIRAHSTSFLICVADVRLAQAKMKQRFDDYQAVDDEWLAVHDSAVVHKSTLLKNGCRVGPNAVIGANCCLGENVVVRANAMIEHGVTIGRDSIVHAGANIGYNSQLGERVTIQAGAVIGSEGFGFAPDADNKYHRVPHTGRVILGDDVHIGANTCIDRGTYNATEIANGVKIDNLVHIAHNVEIGADSLLTAHTVVAGSSKLGKRVLTSGQTGILDHKTIADDVVLVQRCGVTEDITSSGMWAGTPARPFKEYVRTVNLGKKVKQLEQKLKELQQRLDESVTGK